MYQLNQSNLPLFLIQIVKKPEIFWLKLKTCLTSRKTLNGCFSVDRRIGGSFAD